jgi:hypothetical protein
MGESLAKKCAFMLSCPPYAYGLPGGMGSGGDSQAFSLWENHA